MTQEELRFLADLTTIQVRRIADANRAEDLPELAVWIGRLPARSMRGTGTLVLDNKTLPSDSTTDVALNLDLSPWPLWAERPVAPQAALDRMTLVVEDASPNSAFAVIALLARLAGCDAKGLLARWAPAITDWERTGTARRARNEWPALASSLVHAQFARDPIATDAGYARAWTQVLRFAAMCLQRGLDPLAIPEDLDFPLLRDARAQLEQDGQAYHDLLAHAETLQLSLPLRATPGRRLLVDALLFVEDDPAGAAKTIFRNDTDNSPLKRGFTLSAIHRPGAPPGDDFIISVDNRRGVGLREVWEELERLEDARWAGTRPSDSPRDPARLGRANQPWWLTADETLVAAPRHVTVAGRSIPGSRLGWDEVRAALWRVGNPLQHVRVAGLDGRVMPLDALPCEVTKGKVVRLARWVRDAEGAPRALAQAPTIDRILAALTRRVPGLDDVTSLPPPGSWARVGLAGGLAVVTGEGVFVLDDWQGSAHPDMVNLATICGRAAALDEELTRQDVQVRSLSEAFTRSIEGKRSLSEQLDLGARAAGIGVRLAALRSGRPHPATADAARLQAALDAAWALDSRLSAMEAQVQAIGASMRALGDANMRWWTQVVALVAFPFYLATGLAKPVAGWLTALGVRAGWWAPPAAASAEPSLLAWTAAAAGVFALALLMAWRFMRRNARQAATSSAA